MIQITPQMRILVAVESVDFRKGIDGLAQVCKAVLKHDPFGGQVFVFLNRPATVLKVLVYDGQGFWLCHKRLSSGRFHWWPTHATAAAKTLAAHQLHVLLSAGNPEVVQVARRGGLSPLSVEATMPTHASRRRGAWPNRVKLIFPFSSVVCYGASATRTSPFSAGLSPCRGFRRRRVLV